MKPPNAMRRPSTLSGPIPNLLQVGPPQVQNPIAAAGASINQKLVSKIFD
jgi:hypothetical protein